MLFTNRHYELKETVNDYVCVIMTEDKKKQGFKKAMKSQTIITTTCQCTSRMIFLSHKDPAIDLNHDVKRKDHDEGTWVQISLVITTTHLQNAQDCIYIYIYIYVCVFQNSLPMCPSVCYSLHSRN